MEEPPVVEDGYNLCEIAYAISYPNPSRIGAAIADYVTHLAATHDAFTTRGGNADRTKANAMKHYIWNIMMVCSDDVGLNHANQIAHNHEYCMGSPRGLEADFQMDTFNNIKGQKMGEKVKDDGKCSDEAYIINLAVQNLGSLIVLLP